MAIHIFINVALEMRGKKERENKCERGIKAQEAMKISVEGLVEGRTGDVI